MKIGDLVYHIEDKASKIYDPGMVMTIAKEDEELYAWVLFQNGPVLERRAIENLRSCHEDKGWGSARV